MLLPNFLIVGAMKSGTTSLFRDLETHPAVYFPLDKEPGNLLHDEVLTDAGRRQYAKLFARASGAAMRGEASTAYTMAPLHEGVPQRARQLLGASLRIVYIVRHPIDRAISHYHHWYQAGRLSSDINAELIQCRHLVDFSSYSRQISAWLDWYPQQNIRVVQFEQYVADRQKQFDDLASFLGLTPARLADSDQVHNSAGSVKRFPKWLERLAYSRLYRNHLRPMISSNVRYRLAQKLARRRPPVTTRVSDEAIARLYEALIDDAAHLSEAFQLPMTLGSIDEEVQRFAK